MFAQENTIFVTGTTLDNYLENGWYRMGQHIFTTNSIAQPSAYNNGNEISFPVFWIRYNLHKYTATKKHQQLLQKTKIFAANAHIFILTPQIELLYTNYHSQINFDASPSITEVLYNTHPIEEITKAIYNTNCVTLTYQNEIIAVGIFDLGKKTISGITNFYDPAFKKYSLGKVMVLHKLQFAMQNNLDFYYPGYIVPGVPKFDYKIFVGKNCIEVWDIEKKIWVNYNNFFDEKKIN